MWAKLVVVGCHRDRCGAPIDVSRWSELWEDLNYRIVRDEVVTPTRFSVRTVREGIDDIVGAMFAVGVSHNGSTWTTVAQPSTEANAIHTHIVAVAEIRTTLSMPKAVIT